MLISLINKTKLLNLVFNPNQFKGIVIDDILQVKTFEDQIGYTLVMVTGFSRKLGVVHWKCLHENYGMFHSGSFYGDILAHYSIKLERWTYREE